MVRRLLFVVALSGACSGSASAPQHGAAGGGAGGSAGGQGGMAVVPDAAAPAPDGPVIGGVVGDLPLPAPTTGGTTTTFDHDNGDVDVWDLLRRLQEEGPPTYVSRVHGCPKMRYATIGRVLASRGVDLAADGELSAGRLYRSADQALGAANYGARIPESLELTTASASKLFDLFVAAAPEIIANLPSRPECTVGGVGTAMFNAQGQCTADGITCLLGVPAQAGHIEQCNRIIGMASTPERGRIIAVAALLAAAHTCE